MRDVSLARLFLVAAVAAAGCSTESTGRVPTGSDTHDQPLECSLDLDCQSASDCPSAAPYCDVEAGRCVQTPPQCQSDSDCGEDSPFCHSSGYCWPVPQMNCRAGWGVFEGECDNAACIEEECPTGTLLDTETCFCNATGPAPSCASQSDCSAAYPYCDSATGTCSQTPPECEWDGDCGEESPFCHSSGYCWPVPELNCPAGWTVFEGECDNPACEQSECPAGTILNEDTCACELPAICLAEAICEMSCSSASDCPTAAPYCDMATNSCVQTPPECEWDGDCGEDSPFCHSSGYCWPVPQMNCRAGWGVFEGECDNAACIEEECPAGTLLDTETCFCNATGPAPACSSRRDCNDAYPYCDSASGHCSQTPPECEWDGECGEESPFCHSSGYCWPVPELNCPAGWTVFEGECDNPACEQSECPAGTILNEDTCACELLCGE